MGIFFNVNNFEMDAYITEILLKVAFNIINPNHKFHRKASISKLFTLKNIPIS
jgi:hypothetical protein